MTVVSKFLFDTEFESDIDAGNASDRENAKPQTFSVEELELAKQEAFAAGAVAGREEAERQTARLLADALATVSTGLDRILAEADAQHAARQRVAIAAVTEIARRLLPSLCKREALSEIEALVGECLARLTDEPRLVIRVNDQLLDPMRQRLDGLAGATGFAGRIILLADSSLQPTDARVEWADGGAERNVQSVWHEIEGAIQRFVQDGSGVPGVIR